MRREFAFEVTIKASGENCSDMLKAMGRCGPAARRRRDEAHRNCQLRGVRLAPGDGA